MKTFTARLAMLFFSGLAIFFTISSHGAEFLPWQPQIKEVAPAVFVVMGDMASPSAANRGNTANRGFIVAKTGVIVVDSGTSDEAGQQLIDIIREITGKPIVLVINTHAGPDHVLGNSSFRRLDIPILAHRDAGQFMVQNCQNCLRTLREEIGDEPLIGTEIAYPDELLESSESRFVGGRHIELVQFGWAHAPGDIAVLDRISGVMFTGDLIYLNRLPDLRTARIRNWIIALDQLRKMPLNLIVPGHGPVSSPERIGEMSSYLGNLLAQVEQDYRNGKSILDISKSVSLPAFSGWAQYSTLQPANAHFVFLELEREDLEQ